MVNVNVIIGITSIALWLLLVPTYAESAAYQWFDGQTYKQVGSKSGSTGYTAPESFWQRVTSDNNLGPKASKASGTGSKLGRAGAVGKKLMKGGKAMGYGAMGAMVFSFGKQVYDDIKDHPEDWPVLSRLLCQTVGVCPKEEDDDSPYKPGDRIQLDQCKIVITSTETDGPYCYNSQTVKDGEPSCSASYFVTFRRGGGLDCKPAETQKSYLRDWHSYTRIYNTNDEDNPTYPNELTPDQEENLSERILDELEKLNENANKLINELERLVNRHPDSLQWDAIDVESVRDNLYKDEADTLREQQEELENRLKEDPNNAELLRQLDELQQRIAELDRQRNLERLADEEKKQEQETFSPIARETWDPYDPGTFDIPKRFNDMIDVVKGTSLFSFSRGFFESLPSGGSPVVTFDGGKTFGNHTIDLSDTMKTGLVAFRAVVMVIFGFLAIRAVIMKR